MWTLADALGRRDGREAAYQRAKPCYRLALNTLRQRADQHPAEPAVQRALASTYRRLGIVAKRERDLPACRDHLERAATIYEVLAAFAPGYPSAWLDLSQALCDLGDACVHLRDFEVARRYHLQAAEVGELASARAPHDPDVQWHLVDCYTALGNTFRRLKLIPDATERYERAIQIAMRLANSHPDDESTLDAVGLMAGALGELCRRHGDLSRSRQYLEQARLIAAGFAARYPDRVAPQIELALLCTQLGDVCRREEDDAGALRLLGQSVRIEERLVENNPGIHDLRLHLAESYHNLAALLSDVGNQEMAECYNHQALAVCEQLAALAESPRALRVKLAWYCSVVADEFERRSKWQEANRYRELWDHTRPDS